MPAYDASIWDRIAELESRVKAAEEELVWTRRRNAELQTAIMLRPGVTAETEDTPPYPAYAAGEADLPVITQDVHELGTVATWSDRYSTPLITAASRVWYPPGCPVEIAHDGKRWRIVRGPALLHGVASTDIGTAAWNTPCTEYTLGSATVQVWAKSGSVYVPQEYSDSNPVEMAFHNVSAAVSSCKLLVAQLNADGEWIVTVEPCELECCPEEYYA